MSDAEELAAGAVCKGSVSYFYERPLPIDEYGVRTIDVEAVDEARLMCDRCPVRRLCFAQVMADEAGKAISNRDGVSAGMTPHQRHSVEKRNAVRCPLCDAVLDPTLVRDGVVRCPVNARHVSRRGPVIPEDGDGWTKRHTALARRVVQWLDDYPDDSVLRPQTLARRWDERPTDMARVYEALVMDGTIKRTSRGYSRARRARAVRPDPSTWLPLHLRGVA